MHRTIGGASCASSQERVSASHWALGIAYQLLTNQNPEERLVHTGRIRGAHDQPLQRRLIGNWLAGSARRHCVIRARQEGGEDIRSGY